MEIPTVKVEHAPSPNVKDEDSDYEGTPFPDDDDIYEHDNDLDFATAQQNVWLSHVPKSLWESLASFDDDEEIEIGTIRVERKGNVDSRISLKLHDTIPQLEDQPKEYVLQKTDRATTQPSLNTSTYIFSEKDLPGYKSKTFGWDNVDSDGNQAQGRSYLYERNKREQKKKESKAQNQGQNRFQPYIKRTIPKQTAITGTVTSSYDMLPVKNQEYFNLESARTTSLLTMPEKQQATIIKGRYDPRSQQIYLTMAEKAAITKQQALRRQKAKASRASRIDSTSLITKLFSLFQQYKVWAFKDVHARINQPNEWLRECLEQIAILHKTGDFTGRYVLRDEYQKDPSSFDPNKVEIKAQPDLEMAQAEEDGEGLEGDEDGGGEDFEDVKMEG